jgi:PIN domain nuclease of toxin-antitoxin system
LNAGTGHTANRSGHHALIWFLNGDEKLSSNVRDAIKNPNNSKIVSIASIWEISIKRFN